MEYSYRQEHLSRWFLPSLLFHLLIVSAFLMLEHEHTEPYEAEVRFADEQELQQVQPVSTVAEPLPDDQEVLFSINLPESSSFGMTQLENETVQLAGNSPQEVVQESQPPVTHEHTKTEHHEAEEKPSEKASAQPEPTTPPQKDQSIEPMSEKLKEQVPPEVPRPHEHDKVKEHQDRHESQQSVQPAPQSMPHQQTARKPVGKQGSSAQSSSPLAQSMSLQKLADGFLNYTKEKGTTVDINSKDLHLEPTLQKIGWFLQNSFHLHNKPIALNEDVRTSVILHLEIDAKGNLLNTSLSPRTNIAALDNNLLRVVHGAAPFPPLPEHILKTRKTLNIKIPIEINARKGTHEYYFVFRG